MSPLTSLPSLPAGPPRIVSELAERHPGTVPSDEEALRRFFEFRDFAHFIEVYFR